MHNNHASCYSCIPSDFGNGKSAFAVIVGILLMIIPLLFSSALFHNEDWSLVRQWCTRQDVTTIRSGQLYVETLSCVEMAHEGLLPWSAGSSRRVEPKMSCMH
eukprot:6300908-Amphidinium_carterae.1